MIPVIYTMFDMCFSPLQFCIPASLSFWCLVSSLLVSSLVLISSHSTFMLIIQPPHQSVRFFLFHCPFVFPYLESIHHEMLWSSDVIFLEFVKKLFFAFPSDISNCTLSSLDWFISSSWHSSTDLLCHVFSRLSNGQLCLHRFSERHLSCFSSLKCRDKAFCKLHRLVSNAEIYKTFNIKLFVQEKVVLDLNTWTTCVW